MALKIDWDAAENRQVQIDILTERYNQVCHDLLKERRSLKQSRGQAERKKHQYYIKRLEEKKQGFKRVLLEKYGVKLETRGRPPLSPDMRRENNQTKLTVRIKKENAEYMAALKKDKLIDSYGQFFDFLITVFRQQSRQE